MQITFYDENRGILGTTVVGNWVGTAPWQQVTKRIDVPPRARESILCIGLLGCLGEISFDKIEMKVLNK